MRLNKKGYMLVEIIVAAVIAFSIAYYLLNLTFKFKDKNEIVHDSRDLNSIKINVTKNIMNDLDGKDIGFKIENGNIVGMSTNSIQFYVNGSPRKLVIDNNNKEIKYGYHTNGTIKMTKLSNDPYYVKNLSSYNYLNIDNITIKDSVKNDEIVVSIDIPISSIYTDEVVHIKLLLHGQEYEESDHPFYIGDVEFNSFIELLRSFNDGETKVISTKSSATSTNDDMGSESNSEIDYGSFVLPGKNDDSNLDIDLGNKNLIFDAPLQVKEDSIVTLRGSSTISFSSNIDDDSDLIDNQGKLVLDGVSLVDNNGGTGSFINSGGDATLKIQGETNITSNAKSGVAVINGGNIEMSGGVINVHKTRGIYTNGELIITGGTINKKFDSTVESTGAPIQYYGTGVATITNATINMVNAKSYSITNSSTGRINIENVKIDNNKQICVVNRVKGKIFVAGDTYKCKDSYFYNMSTGTFNVNKSETTLDNEYGITKAYKGDGFTYVS